MIQEVVSICLNLWEKKEFLQSLKVHGHAGLWLVIDKISDLVYKMQKSPKSKAKFVHHDRLKPNFTSIKSWLEGKDSVSVNDSENEINENVEVKSREKQREWVLRMK